MNDLYIEQIDYYGVQGTHGYSQWENIKNLFYILRCNKSEIFLQVQPKRETKDIKWNMT